MKKFACMLAAAVVLLAGSRVMAEPITAIDGINGGFQLHSPGAGVSNVATIHFESSFTTQLNHQLIAFTPTYIIDVSINTLGTAVTGGTQYLFNPLSYPSGQIIHFGSGDATFDLTGATAFVPTLAPNTMILQGTLQLMSNLSSHDLSPFLDPNSTFTFTLNSTLGGIDGLIAGGSHPSKDSFTGSASFSECVTPEPSSLVLLGMGSLGMVGYVWRRRNRLALA